MSTIPLSVITKRFKKIRKAVRAGDNELTLELLEKLQADCMYKIGGLVREVDRLKNKIKPVRFDLHVVEKNSAANRINISIRDKTLTFEHSHNASTLVVEEMRVFCIKIIKDLSEKCVCSDYTGQIKFRDGMYKVNLQGSKYYNPMCYKMSPSGEFESIIVKGGEQNEEI